MRRVKLCFPEKFSRFCPLLIHFAMALNELRASQSHCFLMCFSPVSFFLLLYTYILHHLCLASSCSFRFFLIFLINQNSERSTFCCFTLLQSVHVTGKHTISTWSTSTVALFTVNSCCKLYSLKPRKKKKENNNKTSTLFDSKEFRNSKFGIRWWSIFVCVRNRDVGFRWLG